MDASRWPCRPSVLGPYNHKALRPEGLKAHGPKDFGAGGIEALRLFVSRGKRGQLPKADRLSATHIATIWQWPLRIDDPQHGAQCLSAWAHNTASPHITARLHPQHALPSVWLIPQSRPGDPTALPSHSSSSPPIFLASLSQVLVIVVTMGQTESQT